MAKRRNKTVLIVVGVAAAAGVAYLLLKKSTPTATTQLPAGYHLPTPTGTATSSGGGVLASVTDLFSTVLKNANVQSWLNGLFHSEDSPSGTFTAGGNAETPSLPSYLDYTGNQTSYDV